jgi:hypothetical protein
MWSGSVAQFLRDDLETAWIADANATGETEVAEIIGVVWRYVPALALAIVQRHNGAMTMGSSRAVVRIIARAIAAG